MSDIAKQLRETHSENYGLLHEEAAAEIERLNREIAQMRFQSGDSIELAEAEQRGFERGVERRDQRHHANRMSEGRGGEMMDDNIESLAARRADKSGDCRDWSVTDALREALQMVESGEIKADMVYVALSAPVAGNDREFVYKAAGGKRLELIGLLYEHLQQRAYRG